MIIAVNRKWLPAMISGLMLTAAFPKVGMSFLAWVALVPLLISLRGMRRREAFTTGMITGLTHYLTLMYWVVYTMHTYGYLPWWQSVSLLGLLATYLAVYTGIFALMVVHSCRKPGDLLLRLPLFWVSLEYLRSFLFSGFPWSLVGYSQFNRLHIIQISDMFGVYGVSFLIVLVNAAIYELLLVAVHKTWNRYPVSRRQAMLAVALPLGLAGIALAYGHVRISALDEAVADAPRVRVALVQGNIDQAQKWDPAFQIGTTKKYIGLTASVAGQRPDLVVWPETATPFYFEASPKLTGVVVDAIHQAGVHLLVGSPSVQGEPDRPIYRNSAYLVTPDGAITDRYDKVHLVPFGEYVPLKWLLSFVGKMVAQVGDFSSGEKGHVLNWGADRPPIGVQICFEIIFPELCRALVNNGAGLLINLTNDAWFGRSSAAYQHFSMTVFRAVENRRCLVRCANTGISGVVDPIGRVMRRTALFEDAVVVEDVPVMTENTIYTRIGDLLPLLCLILSIVLTVGTRRNGDTAAAGRRQAHYIGCLQQFLGRLVQWRDDKRR